MRTLAVDIVLDFINKYDRYKTKALEYTKEIQRNALAKSASSPALTVRNLWYLQLCSRSKIKQHQCPRPKRKENLVSPVSIITQLRVLLDSVSSPL